MILKSLRQSVDAIVDIGTVLVIASIFIAMMLIAYVVFTLKSMLLPTYPAAATSDAGNATNAAWNTTWRETSQSMGNITSGFDQSINFLVIAIIIFIVAIAIGALLFIRSGKQE